MAERVYVTITVELRPEDGWTEADLTVMTDADIIENARGSIPLTEIRRGDWAVLRDAERSQS